MACIGASAARALALYFGNHDIPVTIQWASTDGINYVARPFAGLWQIAEHQAASREYGGIHYRFDTTVTGSLPEGGRLHLRQLHPAETTLRNRATFPCGSWRPTSAAVFQATLYQATSFKTGVCAVRNWPRLVERPTRPARCSPCAGR
jgi:hypothetical protein